MPPKTGYGSVPNPYFVSKNIPGRAGRLMLHQKNVVSGKVCVMKGSENYLIISIGTVPTYGLGTVCLAVVIGSIASSNALVYSDIAPRYSISRSMTKQNWPRNVEQWY